jgi:hypothetical protein
VHEEDTLQGLALRYGVTVHHIQKLNNLWDSETIHSRTTLKIPTTSATPSPVLKKKNKTPSPAVSSSLQDIRKMDESGENGEEGEEVRRKPSTRMKRASMEPFEERSIASILTAADERIAEMHRFNEKLALKTAHLKQPADAYNRPRPQPRDSLSPSLTNHSENSSSNQSSMEVVMERGKLPKKEEQRRRKLAQESSESLSNSRDTIEDHIFEL